jgi:GNAT superfamily N-acetyltransferase
VIDVAAVEAAAFRSWPAEIQDELDGWVLRCSPGLRARRLNSATTPFAAAGDPIARIPQVARWLIGHGMQPVVRVLSTSDPAIDRHLDVARWTLESPTLTMTRRLGAVAADQRVVIEPHPSSRWTDAKRRLTGMSETNIAAWLRRAAAIRGELGFASIAGEAAPVSMGLGVVEGDRLGLFDLNTDPAYRRQGMARAVLAALEGWAVGRGAGHAYLQVEERNAPAVSLYGGVGYLACYSYWYRRRPDASAGRA